MAPSEDCGSKRWPRTLAVVVLLAVPALSFGIYWWTAHSAVAPAVEGGVVPAPRPPEPLIEDGTLSGTVTDTAKAPIVGATVLAYPVRKESMDEAWRVAHSRTTRTDADGRFVLTGLAAGAVFADAQAVGYCGTRESRVQTVTGDTWLALQLLRCACASGTVRDGEGNPLPGITVELGSFKPAAGFHLGRGGYDAVVKTDENGQFTMGALPAGAIELEAARGEEKRIQYLELAPGDHPKSVDFKF